MTKLVNVSRRKAIFRVLAFFEIIFVIATIAVLFLPYFSESILGEKGDAKTIFDFLKDIFEIENAEIRIQTLKMYKWPILGVILIVLGVFLGMTNIFKSKLSVAKIKFSVLICVIALAMVIIGVYFLSPFQFIPAEYKGIYDENNIVIVSEIGAKLRYVALGSPVLGLVETFIFIGKIPSATVCLAKTMEEKRQHDIENDACKNS